MDQYAAIVFALWVAGWILSRIALALCGRDAQTRRSRLALHIALLFHQPIHALICSKRHIDGAIRELRTKRR